MKLPFQASYFQAESFEGQPHWSDILAGGAEERSSGEWSRASHDLNGVVKAEQESPAASPQIQGRILY